MSHGSGWAEKLPALLASILLCCAMFPEVVMANTVAPVPWLVVNSSGGYGMRQYGYQDEATGKMVIPATWDMARPFTNGWAVVGKRADGEHGVNDITFGVINQQGKVVIPAKYDSIELVAHGAKALVFLRSQYNAWWRFWDWHGFSILDHQPMTRVLRDKWQVMTLPHKKKLFSSDMTYTTSLGFGYHHLFVSSLNAPYVIPFKLRIRSDCDLIGIGHRLYFWVAGRLQKLSSDLVDMGRGCVALVSVGDHRFARIGSDGQQLNGALARAQFVALHGKHGEVLPLRLTSFSTRHYWRRQFDAAGSTPPRTWAGQTLTAPATTFKATYMTEQPFYRDGNGRYYLAPDYRHPLPSVISDYKDAQGTYTATGIMGKARLIVALPGNAGFLVVMNNAFAEPDRAFILSADGSWNTTAPAFLREPTLLFPDGRIAFVGPGSRGVLNTDLSFSPTPLSTTRPYPSHPGWYIGQDKETGRFGIYDAANQRWQVPPDYDAIAGELEPGVVVYRKDITRHQENGTPSYDRRYGLLDVEDARTLTPAQYSFVDADGRVGRRWPMVNPYGVDIEPGLAFYINLSTGNARVTVKGSG